jgi:hypothetical protein
VLSGARELKNKFATSNDSSRSDKYGIIVLIQRKKSGDASGPRLLPKGLFRITASSSPTRFSKNSEHGKVYLDNET